MTQISPGVVTREIDLSSYVPGVNTTVGAFCGVFQWGPLDEIVTLSNEGQLVSKFGKPTLDTATSFFTAARFLSYADALRVVRVASTKSVLVGFDNVSTDGTLLTGTGFLSGPIKIRTGSTVTFGAESKTVVSVTDTEISLDEPFAANLTDESVTFSVYAGALNATAEDGTGSGDAGIGVLIKNESHYESDFANGLANVGPFAARCPGALGNSLEVSVCSSATAFADKQPLAGTVSSIGTSVTGNGTAFLSRVVPGTILKDVTTGQERKVVSVASNTSLTVDKAFPTDLGMGSKLVAKWEYADAIGVAPGTSDFVLGKQGKDDQLHIVVVDRGGEITGIPGTVLERHSFLSKAVDAKDDDGTSNYYVNKINRNSSWVWWTDHIPAGTNWGSTAAGTEFVAIEKPATMRLTGGKDDNSEVNAARNLGYDLFADPESVDVALLLCGEASASVVLHVLGIAESRGDCIALISPEKDDVVSAVGKEAERVIEFRNTLTSSSYGVMSSNWLNIYDKYRDVFVWVPDNGDLAGIIARSDVQSAPWVPPAGYNRGVLREVAKLAWNPRKAARDDLYLAGINFVVSQAGSGPVWLGDKTLLNKPSAFDRINVRRLFIVLKKSISKIANGLIHEINDDVTRTNFRNQVEPFLRNVQARRGVYDSKVVCDSTNNTAEVIDRNEFVGDVYVKPTKSINFITLNFVATRTGVSFSEIVGSF